jgi:hypothetical protein
MNHLKERIDEILMKLHHHFPNGGNLYFPGNPEYDDMIIEILEAHPYVQSAKKVQLENRHGVDILISVLPGAMISYDGINWSKA